MFGSVARRKIERDAKAIAEAIQTIVFTIHTTSSLDEMSELLKRAEFENFKIVSDDIDHAIRHKKILFFSSSKVDIKNFKFWVTYKKENEIGIERSLISENTGDYFGVMIFWSDQDDAIGPISVELSEIAIKRNYLGKNAKALADILLKFPGFSNNKNMWNKLTNTL